MNKKDQAAGKIARCPLSFLLLDPPPPVKPFKSLSTFRSSFYDVVKLFSYDFLDFIEMGNRGEVSPTRTMLNS